jgi:glycosyltransferase involved in cell wall biosynthesis
MTGLSGVSHKPSEEVRSVLGVNCEVIPLPMKLELYKPRSINEREDMVVHIGARPVKNPHISIEAIKTLRKRGCNIKLIVVGASSEIPKYEGIEFRYGLAENEKNELRD